MSKRTVIFAILFIVGISLLNVGVLIEASYEANQFDVDAFKLPPLVSVNISLQPNKLCNNVSNACDISTKNNNCWQMPRNCTDQTS